jgi:hypothetical protein
MSSAIFKGDTFQVNYGNQSPCAVWGSNGAYCIGFTLTQFGQWSSGVTNSVSFTDPLIPGVWLICANAYFNNAPNSNIIVTYPCTNCSTSCTDGSAYGGLNDTYDNTFGKGGLNNYNFGNDYVLCTATDSNGAANSANSLSASAILIVNSDDSEASTNPTMSVYNQGNGFVNYSFTATRVG